MIQETNGLKLVQRFLFESRQGSAYVRYGEFLDIYMRKRPLVTLANLLIVEEEEKGKGIFTNFLDEVEPFMTIHIENVINPKLHGYFLRRGYVSTSEYDEIVSYMRNP